MALFMSSVWPYHFFLWSHVVIVFYGLLLVYFFSCLLHFESWELVGKEKS